MTTNILAACLRLGLAVLGMGTGVLTWIATQNFVLGLGAGLAIGAAAVLACHTNDRCRDLLEPENNQNRMASNLIDGANAQLGRITSIAAKVEDDEVQFRAQRLNNTATLIIEALQERPSRHGELRHHLINALTEAAETTESYAASVKDSVDAHARGTFLRYLQEAELKLEYVARSFVSNAQG